MAGGLCARRAPIRLTHLALNANPAFSLRANVSSNTKIPEGKCDPPRSPRSQPFGVPLASCAAFCMKECHGRRRLGAMSRSLLV